MRTRIPFTLMSIATACWLLAAGPASANKTVAKTKTPKTKTLETAITVYLAATDIGVAALLDALIELWQADHIELRLGFVAFREPRSKAVGKRSRIGTQLLCLKKHYVRRQHWLQAMQCVVRNWATMPRRFGYCIKPNGGGPMAKVRMNRVAACASGPEGKALLIASQRRAKKAAVTKSPTIFIANKRFSGAADGFAIKEALCKGASEPKPAWCAELFAHRIGVFECDRYLEALTRCVSTRMPASARGVMIKALGTVRRAWKKAASTAAGRKTIAKGCKAALAASRREMAAFQCTWPNG
jgi:hypothetical protein